MKSVTVLPETTDLDAITDPAKRIILSCERAKTWLAHALAGDQIEQIAEIKSQAQAMQAYARQKQLGEDAQISAAEIVRRAERCIALGIRKGQKEGRIARQGQGGSQPPHAKRPRRDNGISRPSDFISANELYDNRTGVYKMTDGVTDKQFEAGIAKGRAQKNLTRANVVRNVKGNGKADRWERFAELAAAGNTSYQIAKELGVVRQSVMKRAARDSINIHADRVVGSSRIPKPDRILSEFVNTLEALVPSCEMINLEVVKREVLVESLQIMDAAMPALTRLRKGLKKKVENG